MGISIQEALGIPPLDRAQVLAGSGGLARTIRGVGVMEAPDAATWVKGDELVLTTGFFFRDSLPDLVDLIRAIHGKGAAALGINVDRWVKEIPPEALRAAEALNFPLLMLPKDLPWLEIITPLMNEVFLHHGQQVHRRFVNAALNGGMVEILSEAGAVLQRPLAMFDSDGKMAGWSDPVHVTSYEQVTDWLRSRPDSESLWNEMVHWHNPVRRIRDHVTGGDVLLVPLRSAKNTEGLLVVWEAGQALDQVGLLTLEHAATMLTLEFQKQRSLHAVERRYQDQFFMDLLFGHYKSSDEMISRGNLFGIDLRGEKVVLVLDLESPCSSGTPSPDLRERLIATATWTLRAHPVKSCWVILNECLVVLVEEGKAKERDQPAVALAQSLLAEVRRVLPGAETTVGIGTSVMEARHVARSFEEARQALSMGKLLWGAGRTVQFKDLGVYQLILKDRSSEELLRYKESVLGSLSANDEASGYLLDTLETYLDSSNSVSATAAKLFVHTNTVKYRVGRVRDMLGVNLDENDVRMRLIVALKIRRMKNMGALPKES